MATLLLEVTEGASVMHQSPVARNAGCVSLVSM